MFQKLKVKDVELWRSQGVEWRVKIVVYLIAYNEMKKEKTEINRSGESNKICWIIINFYVLAQLALLKIIKSWVLLKIIVP